MGKEEISRCKNADASSLREKKGNPNKFSTEVCIANSRGYRRAADTENGRALQYSQLNT